MAKPNFFKYKYLDKEFNKIIDGMFIRYLLSFAEPRNKNIDISLSKCAKELINAVICNVDSDEVVVTETGNGYTIINNAFCIQTQQVGDFFEGNYEVPVNYAKNNSNYIFCDITETKWNSSELTAEKFLEICKKHKTDNVIFNDFLKQLEKEIKIKRRN